MNKITVIYLVHSVYVPCAEGEEEISPCLHESNEQKTHLVLLYLRPKVWEVVAGAACLAIPTLVLLSLFRLFL